VGRHEVADIVHHRPQSNIGLLFICGLVGVSVGLISGKLISKRDDGSGWLNERVHINFRTLFSIVSLSTQILEVRMEMYFTF